MTFEAMERICFATSITDLNRPNTGTDDNEVDDDDHDDDDDDNSMYILIIRKVVSRLRGSHFKLLAAI
jgi:hypothetical protein